MNAVRQRGRLLRSAIAASVVCMSTACSLIAGIEEFHITSAGSDAAHETSALAEGGVDRDGSSPGDSAGALDVERPAADGGACVPVCGANQTCVQGTCIDTLVTGLEDPRSIVTTGNFVVWAEYANGNVERGRVRACPLTGCAASGPVVLASAVTRPVLRRATGSAGVPVLFFGSTRNGQATTRLTEVLDTPGLKNIREAVNILGGAATSSEVVWAEGQAMKSCPRPSCDVPKTFDPMPTSPTASEPVVAFFNGVAFWTPPLQGIASCTVADCSDKATLFSGRSIADLDVDPQGVYAVSPTVSGVLIAMPVAPGVGVVPLPASGTGLIATANSVFVACPSAGVFAVPKATGAFTRKAAARPVDVALAGGFVYWTDQSGAVMRTAE